MLFRVFIACVLTTFVLPAFAMEPAQQFEQLQIEKRQLFFLSLSLTLPIIFFLWYRRLLVISILTFLLSVFVYERIIESMMMAEHDYRQSQHTRDKLKVISTRLQIDIEKYLSTLAGFSVYISSKPELTSEEFDQYAEILLEEDPKLINFSAARDLIVNFVYPLEGNEKVLGLDYRKHKQQRDAVLQVIESRKIMLVGPVNLVQGGAAFIGRAPIYTKNEKLWGIISIPIDMEKLLSDTILKAKEAKLNLAIQNYDINGELISTFHGEPILDNINSQTSINFDVGVGEWKISVSHNGSNNELPQSIVALRAYFFIASLLIAFFLWFRFRQESLRQKLESDLKSDHDLFVSIGQVARVGGWKIDESLEIQSWSAQSSLMIGNWIGFQPTNLADFDSVLSNQDHQMLISKVRAALNSSEPFDIEIKISDGDNGPVWIRAISEGHRSLDGDYLVVTIQDVTDKVLTSKLIEHQATFDSLTGLPNRLFYNDRLEKAIENAKRNNLKLAVLFVDLDKFKPINDNYGHQTGDDVLVEAANRIKKCLRESDTVSRLSGDEFAIILNDIPKYSLVLSIAEKILEVMQQPFVLDKKSIYLSTSIGMTLYPDDASTSSGLLRKADQAMYQVKENGRNGCQFYTKEMQIQSEFKHELLSELVVAIDQKQIIPYFQPILDLENNNVVKCEALARWTKHDGSFVPPIDFISLAEESGLINKLDLLMLNSACNSLSKMKRKVNLSINISPRLFHTKDRALESWITAVKKLSESINITVEITERLISDDSKKALDVLSQLKSFGVRIAIDDFGTGFSSLNYLVKFPVDIIKIDRSFIMNIGVEKASEVLIETIIALAKKMNILVIAEGIENEKQLDYLRNKKCNFGQGYLLGKPMNENDFCTYMDKKAS